jgi:DNA-binding YbaB/EbfC family protein
MSDTGQPDFNGMLQRAREMRSRLERSRDDLTSLEAVGTASGGLVTATVSGDNMLVALAIDSSVIDPDDAESLSELVREAVNEATRKLAAQRGQQMAGLAAGLEGMFTGLRTQEGGIVPRTAVRRREHPDGRPAADG